MSKTGRIKSDLEDLTSLLEIISILKDVASNHFYNTARSKEKLQEFGIAFSDFFRMVSLSDAKSPLIQPVTDTVGIVVITSEGGFMAEMTAKVARAAILEAEKYQTLELLAVGIKGAEKLKPMTDKPMKIITEIEEKGLFATTIEVKDYIINQVQARKIGRVFSVYPRAYTANLIKPCVVKLLPSDELVAKQQNIKDVIEKVIVESTADDVMNYLADIWLTCRIYEQLEDCIIAGYAAQAMQMEAAMEKLKGDKKGLAMSLNKSKKGDIDKSLREVFTAQMITGGGRR